MKKGNEMKAQVKAIMASAVVIALCLAAVGGVTYSWFSDTETTTITVNAAEIDLYDPSISGTAKSYGLSPVTLEATGGNIPLGGSVTISSPTVVLGSITYIITIDEMAPGDEIDLTFTSKLKNTVSASFSAEIDVERTGAGVDGYTGDKLTALAPVCTVGGSVPSDPISGSADYKDVSVSTKIALNETAGNEYQNKQFTITLTITVMQSNYSSS